MSSPLFLYLHGAFRARLGDLPLIGLSRRGQALLAYLALQPDMRAERTKLADLLWSDRSEEQARGSLRQELTVLRKHLPEGILGSDRQAIWLEDEMVRVESGQGTFLDGFDLASEGFEDWLREERSRTESLAPAPVAMRTIPASAIGRPTVAVMRFADLSGATDMFADGVVEEITGALSRVRDFHVIARQSSFALAADSQSPTVASQKLGAAYIVEGSVRRSGDRVRLATGLVRGADGHVVWSERFDDRIDDLFDMQDRIAAKVAGQISPNVRMAEITRARSTPPADRSAYELVLSAMPHFWAHLPEENLRAIELFDKALECDPDYALALAMKAWGYAQQAAYFWTEDPARARIIALETADRAAADSGVHAMTLVGTGAAISMTSNDIGRANSFIDRALAIDPNCAWGWMRKGFVHVYMDDAAAAMEAFDRAIDLSPLDPYLHNMIIGQGMAEFRAQNYEAAAQLIERGMALGAGGGLWAVRPLMSIYFQLGRDDDARRVARTFLEANPGMTIKRILTSLPPAFLARGQFPLYLDGLRRAGIPEE